MQADWKTTRLNATLTKRESDVRKEEKREELRKILSIETFRILFTLSILSISIHLLPCFQFLQSCNAKTSLPLSPLSPSGPSMQRVYFLLRLFHVLFPHSFLVPSPVHHMPSYNEKWNCGQIREQYGIQRVEAMFWAIERSVVLTQ